MEQTDMKRRLAALLSVKSLVTLTLTAVFALLALRGSVDRESFMTVFTVVIAFYFGTQNAKQEGKSHEDSGN